jgi:hypothetical protein
LGFIAVDGSCSDAFFFLVMMCLKLIKNSFHLKTKSQKRTRVATSQDTEKTVIPLYFTIFISFIFENGIIEKRALNEKDLIGWILG